MAGTMKMTDRVWKEMKAMERSEKQTKRKVWNDPYWDDDFDYERCVHTNRAGDRYVNATKVC